MVIFGLTVKRKEIDPIIERYFLDEKSFQMSTYKNLCKWKFKKRLV